VVREGTRGGRLAQGSSLMGIRDQQRRLKRLAERLRQGDDLSKVEREWIANAFTDVANGRDANDALAVKRKRGQSTEDEIARERMNFTLFWVAGAMENGIQAEEAFLEGARLLRKLHGLDPDSPDEEYGVETLRRYWNSRPEWQRPERFPGEDDFLL